MRLYRCLAVSVGLALAACASTPDTADAPADATAFETGTLGPQQLGPGECGLFAWARPDGEFLFFATEEGAKYARDGVVRRLQPGGEFPATRYGPVELQLGESEPLINGRRYARARLTETLEDGFRRVQPVVALVSCQPRA